MSTQLRLRRGTTTEHATFTGADGELTWDTTKKCVVTHDGVTTGGVPLHNWLTLSPPLPSSLQTLTGILAISGNDGWGFGLDVLHGAKVHGDFYGDGLGRFNILALTHKVLTWA